MNPSVDELHEQVAANRHGQSPYAQLGERSRDQRHHDGRAALDLVQRIAFAAGRAEGFEAGLRAGHGKIGEYTLDEIDAAIGARS